MVYGLCMCMCLNISMKTEQSLNIGFGIQRILCSLLQFTVMLLGTSGWWFDFCLYFSCALYDLCYKICLLIDFLILKLETRCTCSLCDVFFWNHTVSCIWYSRLKCHIGVRIFFRSLEKMPQILHVTGWWLVAWWMWYLVMCLSSIRFSFFTTNFNFGHTYNVISTVLACF